MLTLSQLPKELVAWPETKSTRKAVINSFGVGGTNAMVVLESPKSYAPQNGSGKWFLPRHARFRSMDGIHFIIDVITDNM
jgi:acyl transferase domain-containing protein